MALSKNEIDNLKALYEASTQGEWHADVNRVDFIRELAYRRNWENDAEFCAAAHNTFPALIAALEEREAAFTAMRDALESATVRMEAMAETLERWSEGSRAGGWSTHLCTPMEGQANELRREASQFRLLAKKAEST